MASRNVPLERPVREFIVPNPLTLRDVWTVDQAIRNLRNQSTEQRAIYFYVVDADQKLVGVVSSRKLLLSTGSTVISTMMSPMVVRIADRETLFDACELFAIHRLLALPVVDSHNRLLGTLDVSLYTQELLDIAEKRNENEVFQLVGLHLARARNRTPWAAFRNRMPWLLCNIGGGLGCAALGAAFEGMLQQVIVISLFIPVVLTLAESVAIQSMSLSLQSAMAAPRLDAKSATQEGAAAGILGICCGLIVAVTSLAWRTASHVPVVIGLSIMISMVVAALLGHVIPRGIRVLKLNPSIASGPIVLALTDVFTITTLLSLTAVFVAKYGGQHG